MSPSREPSLTRGGADARRRSGASHFASVALEHTNVMTLTTTFALMTPVSAFQCSDEVGNYVGSVKRRFRLLELCFQHHAYEDRDS